MKQGLDIAIPLTGRLFLVLASEALTLGLPLHTNLPTAVYDTYSTYKDETPQLIESFNKFISDPAQDSCYEACMSFYRLYGNLLGGFGYFKCHCICSKF